MLKIITGPEGSIPNIEPIRGALDAFAVAYKTWDIPQEHKSLYDDFIDLIWGFELYPALLKYSKSQHYMSVINELAALGDCVLKSIYVKSWSYMKWPYLCKVETVEHIMVSIKIKLMWIKHALGITNIYIDNRTRPSMQTHRLFIGTDVQHYNRLIINKFMRPFNIESDTIIPLDTSELLAIFKKMPEPFVNNDNPHPLSTMFSFLTNTDKLPLLNNLN